MTGDYRDYLTVHSKRLPIPPDLYRLSQIADVIVHWNLIPREIQRIYGHIEMYTSMNSEEPTLRIPFDEQVLHGSLDYQKEETYFFISNENPSNECGPIRVFNQYDVPLVVYNITINKLKLLSKYIEVKHLFSLISTQLTWKSRSNIRRNSLICIRINGLNCYALLFFHNHRHRNSSIV